MVKGGLLPVLRAMMLIIFCHKGRFFRANIECNIFIIRLSKYKVSINLG